MKTLKMTAAALALAATPAMADSYFGLTNAIEPGTGTVVLDTVTADADGFVVLYSDAGMGDMLGWAEVNAGANSDLRIQLDESLASTEQEIVAVLYAGEMGGYATRAAMTEIDVE